MRWLIIGLLVFLGSSVPAHADGPSFDCSRVSANVTKMICADPTLSALDRKLVDDFNNIHAQGGIDAKALDAAESKWLRDVRNKCTTAACIQKAYQGPRRRHIGAVFGRRPARKPTPKPDRFQLRLRPPPRRDHSSVSPVTIGICRNLRDSRARLAISRSCSDQIGKFFPEGRMALGSRSCSTCASRTICRIDDVCDASRPDTCQCLALVHGATR